MGMFDSVIVKCPTCGEENEFQSKSGPCTLIYVSLEDCPADILENVNRHSPCECERCGTFYKVDIKTKSTIIVKKSKKNLAEIIQIGDSQNKLWDEVCNKVIEDCLFNSKTIFDTIEYLKLNYKIESLNP